MIKPGGLLERAMQKQSRTGECRSCSGFIKISETAYGCTIHDKLIMPQYIPYYNGDISKCEDWKGKND